MVLKRSLPPANALVVFEAAARNLNFTLASRELSVAQPAVTRQIKKLEDDLKTRLFHRNNNQLALTAEGEQLFRTVSESLNRIASLADAFRNATAGTLLIGATFPFANLWLAPRLAALRRALPDLSLNVLISEDYENFDAGHVDCSIRFGSGDWPGMRSKLLFLEEAYPMATPELAKDHALSATKDWRGVTLLDQPTDKRKLNWLTWDTWRDRCPGISIAGCSRVAFDNYLFALDAARRGEGMALGMSGLTRKFEADHGLVQVGPSVKRQATGYYLTYPDWHPHPDVMQTAYLALTGFDADS